MSPYRVLITGSRAWNCPDLAYRVLAGLTRKHFPADLLIVHGDCPSGVDAAFARACRESRIAAEPHPADWKAYGRGAGPRRNQEMVDLGAGVCLAFHPTLPPASGTADCVRRALKAGIPTWWTWSEDAPPVRQKLPNIAGVS